MLAAPTAALGLQLAGRHPLGGAGHYAVPAGSRSPRTPAGGEDPKLIASGLLIMPSYRALPLDARVPTNMLQTGDVVSSPLKQSDAPSERAVAAALHDTLGYGQAAEPSRA